MQGGKGEKVCRRGEKTPCLPPQLLDNRLVFQVQLVHYREYVINTYDG